MKSFFLALGIILLTSTVKAQEKYFVGGETYLLKTEVEGSLTLLWNIIDDEYRYFLQKGPALVELKNTQQNGKYQEEYKSVLQEMTADAEIPTQRVNLSLPSLHDFVVKYNKMKDPNYTVTRQNVNLQFRLGVFAGITNSIYTSNPENISQPLAGLELEVVDVVKLKRHVLVLDFQHIFESSDYKYSASQLGLNYRFKFIKTPKLDIYVNAKFASLTFYTKDILLMDEDKATIKEDSGSDFTAPLTLGIGADYKVGKGYITLGYRDIIGLNLESNKEFPLNFSVGYKIRL